VNVGLGRGGVVINSYEIMYMVVNYPLTRAQTPCLVSHSRLEVYVYSFQHIKGIGGIHNAVIYRYSNNHVLMLLAT